MTDPPPGPGVDGNDLWTLHSRVDWSCRRNRDWHWTVARTYMHSCTVCVRADGERERRWFVLKSECPRTHATRTDRPRTGTDTTPWGSSAQGTRRETLRAQGAQWMRFTIVARHADTCTCSCLHAGSACSCNHWRWAGADTDTAETQPLPQQPPGPVHALAPARPPIHTCFPPAQQAFLPVPTCTP